MVEVRRCVCRRIKRSRQLFSLKQSLDNFQVNFKSACSSYSDERDHREIEILCFTTETSARRIAAVERDWSLLVAEIEAVELPELEIFRITRSIFFFFFFL